MGLCEAQKVSEGKKADSSTLLWKIPNVDSHWEKKVD